MNIVSSLGLEYGFGDTVIMQERLAVLAMSSTFSQAQEEEWSCSAGIQRVSRCHPTGTFSGRTHHPPHSLVPSLMQGG